MYPVTSTPCSGRNATTVGADADARGGLRRPRARPSRSMPSSAGVLAGQANDDVAAVQRGAVVAVRDPALHRRRRRWRRAPRRRRRTRRSRSSRSARTTNARGRRGGGRARTRPPCRRPARAMRSTSISGAPSGTSSSARLVRAGEHRLEPLDRRHRLEPVAVAHQRVQRAGEVVLEQAGEALGGQPGVLERTRRPSAERTRSHPQHPLGPVSAAATSRGASQLARRQDRRARRQALRPSCSVKPSTFGEVVLHAVGGAHEGPPPHPALEQPAARRARRAPGARSSGSRPVWRRARAPAGAAPRPQPAAVDPVGELGLDLRPGGRLRSGSAADGARAPAATGFSRAGDGMFGSDRGRMP